ncbi:hypothetical protein FA95DRAFT_1553454 [Auriscalpium vulgare]|uniref:Uncharacterized protein n=1 Tax=Auriscalpium vulgare TaxID=40419 RepID=A0ACB8S8I2_9AGAM|nr:hypothetical protein FA95DRAFT_1553454 [Auriscalpium vulgare]
MFYAPRGFPLSRNSAYPSPAYVPEHLFSSYGHRSEDLAPFSTYPGRLEVPHPFYPEPEHAFNDSASPADERYQRAITELQAAEEEYRSRLGLSRAREAADRRRAVAVETARREEALAFYEEVKLRRALEAQARAEAQAHVVARFERQRAREQERLSRERERQAQLAQRRRALEQQQLLKALLFQEEPEIDLGFQRRHQADVVHVHRHSQPTFNSPFEITLALEEEPEHACGCQSQFHHVPNLALAEFEKSAPKPRRVTPASQPRQLERARVARSEAQSEATSPEEFATVLEDLLGLFLSRIPGAQGDVSHAAAQTVEGKGKGKAPVNERAPETQAQPRAEPLSWQSVLQERISEQERKDIERAIELSLIEKYKGSPSPGASTSKVTLDSVDLARASTLAGAAAAPVKATFQAHSASSAPASPTHVSASAPSPLTAVRHIRTELLSLESASPADPAARVHALEGLLARLDAVESDGDEEVRVVRREVVREVEKALESAEGARKSEPVDVKADVYIEVTEKEKDGVEVEVKGYEVEEPVESVEATEAAEVFVEAASAAPEVVDVRSTLIAPELVPSLPAEGEATHPEEFTSSTATVESVETATQKSEHEERDGDDWSEVSSSPHSAY